MLVALIQDLHYVANIVDFMNIGCNLSIGAVYSDEVGTYLKVSKRLVVVHGDVVSYHVKLAIS